MSDQKTLTAVSEHYPAELRSRDGGDGWETFCGCGGAWPCPHYVPSAPVVSAPLPPLKAGDLCPDCGVFSGLVLREHASGLVCSDCDEDWLDLPTPSSCRVLWDDGDLFLNELWVGYAGRERKGQDHSYATWLRGRGWDDARHRTYAEAQAALIERATREIGTRRRAP